MSEPRETRDYAAELNSAAPAEPLTEKQCELCSLNPARICLGCYEAQRIERAQHTAQQAALRKLRQTLSRIDSERQARGVCSDDAFFRLEELARLLAEPGIGEDRDE